MRAHLWFETSERNPGKSGYYLSYTGATMGGGEPEAKYCYYDKKKDQWRDYESDSSMSRWENVVYWTDADPWSWYENSTTPGKRTDKRKVNAAEQIAFQQVLDAIKNYETIKALSQ